MTTTFAPLPFLSDQILEFETLPSTNEYLKDAASTELFAEGTVVSAIQQTSGKGQHGNIWLSEAGKNITLSILLKPHNLLANEAFRLSKTIALAVYKTVSHFIPKHTSIKWPNDIFADNHKISGILIENSIQGEIIKQSIVGIGLNVNQMVFISENQPTSLHSLSGNSFDLKEVRRVLLENISTEYLQLMLKNYKKIDTNYFQRLHQVYLEQTFTIHNEQKKCFVNDVLADGSIVLTMDGKKEVYLHGEALWKL